MTCQHSLPIQSSSKTTLLKVVLRMNLCILKKMRKKEIVMTGRVSKVKSISSSGKRRQMTRINGLFSFE